MLPTRQTSSSAQLMVAAVTQYKEEGKIVKEIFSLLPHKSRGGFSDESKDI